MVRIAMVAGLLTLALTLVSRAAEDKEKEKKAAKAVVVPFELLKSGHMAVNVKVNGKGPYKLIFDTGAPITLVNNKLAKDAGVIDGKDDKEKPQGFGELGELGGLLGAMLKGVGEARLKEMQIGDARASDVSVVVMDHPTVDALSQALKTPIYGLVGFPFFAQFRMTLDYKAKTMTLTPNGYKPPDVMRGMMQAIMSGNKAKELAPSAQWGIVCAKDKDDESDGVDITGVVPGSAAEKAGLKKGDRLLTLDGRWTDSMTDLYEAAGFVKAGTTVSVKVKRDRKEVSLKVTPTKGL